MTHYERAASLRVRPAHGSDATPQYQQHRQHAGSHGESARAASPGRSRGSIPQRGPLQPVTHSAGTRQRPGAARRRRGRPRGRRQHPRTRRAARTPRSTPAAHRSATAHRRSGDARMSMTAGRAVAGGIATAMYTIASGAHDVMEMVDRAGRPYGVPRSSANSQAATAPKAHEGERGHGDGQCRTAPSPPSRQPIRASLPAVRRRIPPARSRATDSTAGHRAQRRQQPADRRRSVHRAPPRSPRRWRLPGGRPAYGSAQAQRGRAQITRPVAQRMVRGHLDDADRARRPGRRSTSRSAPTAPAPAAAASRPRRRPVRGAPPRRPATWSHSCSPGAGGASDTPGDLQEAAAQEVDRAALRARCRTRGRPRGPASRRRSAVTARGRWAAAGSGCSVRAPCRPTLGAP